MPWQNVGSPFIIISPTNGVFLVYETPGPSLGTLIASIVPPGGPTVDQFGNKLVPGVSEYIVTGGQTYAVSLSTTSYPLGAQSVVGLVVNSVTNPGHSPAGVFGLANSVGVSAPAEALVFLASGEINSSDVNCYILLSSQETSGVTDGVALMQAGLVDVIGSLEIDGAPTAPVNGGIVLGTGGVGGAYFNDVDSNTYSFGTADGVTTGGQVISNGSNQTIIGTPCPIIASQTYSYDLIIVYHGQQAAGAPDFIFDYTAGAAGSTYGVNGFNGSAGSNVINNAGPYAGPTLLNGGRQNFTQSGAITCSSSGTLQIQAQCNTAGDTFTTDYVKFSVRPCNTSM